jgi:hypothetical protein
VIAGVARSSPSLPAIAPQQLVSNMIRVAATDPSLSGTVTAHLGLGLPDLPHEGSGAVTGPAAILDALSGDHRLRVWHPTTASAFRPAPGASAPSWCRERRPGCGTPRT